MEKSNKVIFVLAPLAMVATALNAQPIKYDLSATLGAEYHDNINKSHNNEQSDVKQTVGINVGAFNTRGRFLFDLGYSIWYEDYADDNQSDTTRYDGSGRLTVKVIEDSLDWYIAHQVSEKRTDRAAAAAPDNLETRSIQRTGLDWRLPLGARTVFTLSPQYVDVRYEDSTGSDSERLGGSASLRRILSPTSSVSLIGSYDDVQFEDERFDYEQTGGRINYTVELARTSYQVELGHSEIQREQFEDTDSPVGRLQFDYSGESADWGVYLLYELTDTSLGLSTYELVFEDFESDDSNFDDRDIITRGTLQAHYQRRFAGGDRGEARISFTDEDYETLPQDQEIFRLGLSYYWALAARWEVIPAIQYRRVEFTEDPTGREHDEYEYSVTAQYQYSRPLEFSFGAGMIERDSNVGKSADYEDLYAFASLTYTFF